MDLLFTVFSYWDSILAVILVFGLLIFVHELGHFLANKAMGIGVITFSIGMGPRIAGFKWSKTDFRISLFPFGGFCSAVGEYSDEVEELGFTDKEAIGNRPPWQRMIMAFSGPFANLVLAWLLYWGLTFVAGMAIPLPQVGSVMPDSAAAAAGLQAGDMIIAIDGHPIDSWNQVPEYVGQSDGRELAVTIERNGSGMTLPMTPTRMSRTNVFGEEETAWLIGVQMSGQTRHEPLGFLASAKQGLLQTWNMIDLTVTSLKKLVTGAVSSDSVGGPILIFQMLGQQAQVGLVPLLMLTALISVNLGLLNLLPLPVLDGGIIVFNLIETLFRRPVPEKIQEKAMNFGVALLVCLMLFATYNDVMRWFR